ncbi:hypothetical protein RNJ44_02786 [Nakaseomyces bracarensis]|uniref:5'-3' exoribonuclease 1 n=1 Tax=Nakaseomyces bracarensis TaxID=273131 RepID=A0ABR4P086_9SACH
MGIPKFFRYISERWPMILQLIEGTQIPEFDNLYLDMNSFIHTCTHGNNDDDVTAKMSDEELYSRIFTYIDHLFLMIKPKKVFYMSIDGVAPRAKMNQQRSRRFRTAMDNEKAIQKAIDNGEDIPKGDTFDSNCITPGTEFMAQLTTNLNYYIHDKVTNDANWRDIEVILSGHEVPGEGEHKIMDFIRNITAQDDYDVNTRHCIYGLDADLIMLGLSTHAPHFALLREEVTFGRRNNSATKNLEEQNFYLLHLSLMREYLELEFKEIGDDLQFEFNFENVLDDFILVMFVIGNDFLPNLPDLHLNKGAFPVLLQTFKEALLHVDGYINERGQINFKRLRVWLDYLSQFELMNFENDDIDVEWFNQQLENISLEGERKRQRMGKKLLIKQQKKLVGMVKPWLLKEINKEIPANIDDSDIPQLPLSIESNIIRDNLEFLKQFALDLGLIIVHVKAEDKYYLKLDVDSIKPAESEEQHQSRVNDTRKTIKKYQNAILVEDKEELDQEKVIYNERFENWKAEYYRTKFGIKRDEPERIVDICNNYIEGLQWVLFYYYRGCQSWGWYYHYHYAPRISDLIKGLDQAIEFDLGHPLTPFQQLMAVLPERSKNLMPAAYRPLMYDPKSPILDFYPSEVELDKNGKTADWEAVVLLPFVDEKRLIEATTPCIEKLSPEEKKRNQFGKTLTYMYNPQVDNVYRTALKGIFADIQHNHCVALEYESKPMDGKEFRYGLLPNAKLKTQLLAGFPTLYSLPFTNSLEYNESYVFQQPSRQQSMVLKITDVFKENNMTMKDIADRYLNKIVYTRWPYLRESKLVSISDGIHIIECIPNSKERTVKIVSRSLDNHEKQQFNTMRNTMLRTYAKKKAVILKKIEMLVQVLPVTGLMRKPNGAYSKTYSEQPDYYPLQLLVENVANVDERYIERPPKPIDKEYPVGSKVIFLGDYAYGGEATIDGYSSDSRLKITVKKRFLKTEPTIGKERLKIDQSMIKYYPSYVVSKELHLHPLFLSKITSKFLVTDCTGKNINVGIPIKFEARHQKVLGYARRNPKGWDYSNVAIALLKRYREMFPAFFNKMSKTSGDIPVVQDLFPELSSRAIMSMLDDIKQWIKFSTENFVVVSLESNSLTKTSIRACEEYIEKYSSNIEQHETKQLAKVPREAVLSPRVSFSQLRAQSFDLGDRVIYIQDSGKVPLFSKGTVVGYTTLGLSLSIQVLFDNEIVSGNKFGGRLRTKRGIGLDASFLLNITNKQFIYHSKASKKVSQVKEVKPNVKKTQNQAGPSPVPHKQNVKQVKPAKNEEPASKELLSYIKKGGKSGKKASEKQPTDKTKAKESNQQEHSSENLDINTSQPNLMNATNLYNAVAHQYEPGVAPMMPSQNNAQTAPASLPYFVQNGQVPFPAGNPPMFPMGMPMPGGVAPPGIMMPPHFVNGNVQITGNPLNNVTVDKQGSKDLLQSFKQGGSNEKPRSKKTSNSNKGKQTNHKRNGPKSNNKSKNETDN